MAQLDVQPKKSNPWWLWLVLAIIAIVILIFLLKGCGHGASTAATTDTTGKPAIALTQPDWNSVDFNSPNSADPDVTDTSIKVSGNDKYTIYTLGENILFATDQTTLQGSAAAKLKMIAAAINKRFAGGSIGIYGNTDSTGTAGHNKQLGAERAAMVKDWLVKNGGLNAAKVSVHSLGENKPVASNATAAGRQQNRNVEIVAFPNK
jgi:outer membrane protein OmpA-like peptidoglycan-associated protein